MAGVVTWPAGGQRGWVGLFMTGIGPRPNGAAWALLYDAVLYNVVLRACVVVCLRAARRRPAEATAWRAVAVAQSLSLVGNLWYTLAVAPPEDPPLPLLADALWLAYYPALYVALLAFVRSRDARVHRRP